ncbi:MAG TPA: hypothetical protein VGQ65_01360 [Thermoanaerobaculia bacterium]|jgi:hypothetical protein|nr:hypothetical protein [Thermoanaerobaculia bacterium]
MSDMGELTEIRADWMRIQTDLDVNPLYALSIYDDTMRRATSEFVRERLDHVFSDALSFARAGQDILPKHIFDVLPDKYRRARQRDRRRLVKAIADRLFEYGVAAGNRQDAERDLLAGIGNSFERLILTGTLDQQFACKLAVELGHKQAMTDALRSLVCAPLISALITVLRVGAPTTRDSAVEGLGALLKYFDDPEPMFVINQLPVEDLRKGNADINRDYFERFERRRQMALAVSGNAAARTEYFQDLDDNLDKVECRGSREGFPPYQRALTECADRLRTLTSICRQATNEEKPTLVTRSVALLRRAARVTWIEEDEDGATQAAFARYQESVFHTITVLVEREGNAVEFDEVVSEAIDSIPRTLIGEAPLCNGQSRAAVSIISCAATLLMRAHEPRTTKALRSVFEVLVTPSASPWGNPGIVEGCYRGLPSLLRNAKHNDWTLPALAALFDHLNRPHDFEDFVETHRQLHAAMCFRRVLIAVTENVHDQFVQSEAEETREQRQIELEVRTLLAHPDAEHVRKILQTSDHKTTGAFPRDIAPRVINATAFERDLLARTSSLFQNWPHLSAPRQLLLTRILAAQLRVLSHDAKDVARHRVLNRLYDAMPTITFSDEERQKRLWKLLADLPSEPARAADADLQDFVEHCGVASSTDRLPHPHDDLPGYVLAMIDDSASARIAAAIAREIDLNIRHDRINTPRFDFAATLYQVTLRGPHEAIFEHLFPRMESPLDRDVVLLFRKHVARVRACAEKHKHGLLDLKELLQHVGDVLRDLREPRSAGIAGSATLQRLRLVLHSYRYLVTKGGFWQLAAGGPTGGLGRLFEQLDALDEQTRGVRSGTISEAGLHPNRRDNLTIPFRTMLTELKSRVQEYQELPLNEFAARSNALTRAAEIICGIESRIGVSVELQAPERVILIAILQRYREVFTRTIQWHCVEPRRCVDAGDYELFWSLFATSKARKAACHEGPLKEDAPLLQGDYQGRVTDAIETYTIASHWKALAETCGPEPPKFPGQRLKFEGMFAEWTSSDLEMNHLRDAIGDRWATWFQSFYGTVTSLPRIILIVVIVFGIAIVCDVYEAHEVEGAGFFALAVGAVVMSLVTFSHGLHAVVSKFRRRRVERRPQYRFHAMLPRLARLIAAPIALLVDFNHSYEFPLKASSWPLLLLMVLAFLTTRFFVQREIVDRDRMPLSRGGPERSKMRPIVAVAVAYSFGLSLLFSVIFASNYFDRADVNTVKQKPVVAQVLRPASVTAHVKQELIADPTWVSLTNWWMNRCEEIPAQHAWPRFFGILPRDVTFNLGQTWVCKPLPASIRNYLVFVFYPTLILTWTAIGLFFGVFLEGFLKGRRLRGEKARRAEA